MKTTVKFIVIALILSMACSAQAAQNKSARQAAIPVVGRPAGGSACPLDSASNQELTASVEPVYIVLNGAQREKVAFNLAVTNKTDRDIQIDWNES